MTLGNERISLSTGGVLWGNGPTALDLIEARRPAGPVTDPTLRQRLAGVYIEHTVLELIRLRTLTARLKGEQPGPEASIRKLLADEHGQHVMELARDLIGPAAMLTAATAERGAATRFAPGTETRNLGPMRPPRDLDPPGLVRRLPVLAGADDRRRHRPGAAQHRRRARPRPAPRRRRPAGPQLVGGAARHGTVMRR